MATVVYESDFYGWTLEQTNLLKNGLFDREHLVGELQSMSARERRELLSRLRVLMMHLLKW